MTIEDAQVIGFGSLALMIIFLAAQAIYLSRAQIAAFFSGEWARSIERARQQKAAREALYGYAVVNHSQVRTESDMSSSASAASVSRESIPVSNTGIQPHTDAVLANLTEDQLVEALARRKDARGKYAYSGKKIYSLVGGNYNDFVAKVRQIRGDEVDLQPEHVTPIVGRRTNARFESDPDFPYQAPA